MKFRLPKIDKRACPHRFRAMRLLPTCFLSLTLLHSVAVAEEKAPAAKVDPPAKAAEAPKSVESEGKITIDGKEVPYKVIASKIMLTNEEGKDRASIFHVSYLRSDVADSTKRPVMFCFNGGPGSSAVWLHLGVLGPKIVELPGDGTTAPPPPARLLDNPHSVLDVCDLVFVDPVSTGFSRAGKDVKPSDFHGVDEDIESVGDFVRRWITEHKRWGSPKYLLGESYGGVRVAGLSQHLQSRFGMSLNGVVLLSSLLDFRTLQPSQGSDLSYQVFLSAYTGTAHHHGKIEGDRDRLVAEASEFAFGEYAAALLKGTEIEPAEVQRLAGKLASLTGIDAQLWEKNRLRIDPSAFRAELLRDEGKVIGRFDARVAWDATNPTAQYPDYDPSYALAYGVFATTMLDYLGRDLGWRDDQPYEILTGKVQPWRWNANNQIVNLSGRLSTAMRDNPHLKVLVMGGYTDLATPPDGMAHSMRHLFNLPEGARANVRFTFYDGGHMFYLNPPDLVKTRKDLLEFLGAGQ